MEIRNLVGNVERLFNKLKQFRRVARATTSSLPHSSQ